MASALSEDGSGQDSARGLIPWRVVGACLHWPVGEWRSDGVCHACPCLSWQGVKVEVNHGASALKTKNTLEVSETYLGVVQSLSCV